ncbi:RecA protein [Chelatococcus asaccharovorans]|nr:RecA protein [Chelatococcus asaccharovorans]CAH1688750.1 RecA protein [Chelatococcus asaccharovorans]
MAMSSSSLALSELRDRIARLEGGSARRREVLPFGVPEIDRVLPGGGLALGALHEVAGGAKGAVDGVAAALWAAGDRGRASAIPGTGCRR